MVAVMRLPVGLHPRSHGENVIDDGEARTGGGSSPLTRGKRPASDRGHGTAGLIPAHAGKTVPQGPRRSVSRAHPRSRGKTRTVTVRCIRLRAHPRSRGENVSIRVWMAAGGGSSPLTRGKPIRAPRLSSGHGLIPAHAGKTTWGRAPRSACSGSSPLTRGKRGRRRFR